MNMQGVPGAAGGVHQFAAVISAADLTAGNNLCNAASVTGGFTCPGLDQIGNIRRNSAWGPNLFNADMSIFKNVSIYERVTAQFRMDAFNALTISTTGTRMGPSIRRVQVRSPAAHYPAGLGGTTNPRQLQFTLHLQF